MSSVPIGAPLPIEFFRRSATQTPPVWMPTMRGAVTARADSTLPSATVSTPIACSASTCTSASAGPACVEILDDDLRGERVQLRRVARALLAAPAHLDEAAVGFLRAQALVLRMHRQPEA